MSKQTAKIINLEDYIRARAHFKMEDIKDVLTEIRNGLRTLDGDVTTIVLAEHKLKMIEPKKETALKYEAVLKRISYFLEDKIAETENAAQKDVQKELLKTCETLKSQIESIKKTIADDIGTCRYNEKEMAIDWMKVAGFMVGTPVAVSKYVEEFMTSRPEFVKMSGEVGLVLGTYLAFNRQVNALAGRTAANLPKQIKLVHRSARNVAFAITMNASVAAKQSNDIEIPEPERLTMRPRIVIAAKM